MNEKTQERIASLSRWAKRNGMKLLQKRNRSTMLVQAGPLGQVMCEGSLAYCEGWAQCYAIWVVGK